MNKLDLETLLDGDFSTPWDAPLVPPYPIGFRNCEILTLVYRTDAEAIKALLPPPLVTTSSTVLIHIYDMHDVDYLGHYQECNVMVGAALPGGVAGAYSPYLFLNSDIGVAHGRELHGQPKKFADPSLSVRGDLVVGSVTRNGIEVITGTMAYKQKRGDLSDLSKHMDFALNLNLKAVNHIDGRPAIRQLTSRRLSDVKVHECWRGPCTVELRPNVQAPVYKLPVRDMLEAFYWRADFTLVPGQIIYDYLGVAG